LVRTPLDVLFDQLLEFRPKANFHADILPHRVDEASADMRSSHR